MTECEWRHAPEASRGLWRIERKLESWILDAKRGGSTFGDVRRTCALWWALEMRAKWIRQHRRLCLSSLCRNLYLKVNKKVSYLNKKSLRVFEFRDSYVLRMFYRYEHYMSFSHMAIIVNMVHFLLILLLRADAISFSMFLIFFVYLVVDCRLGCVGIKCQFSHKFTPVTLYQFEDVLIEVWGSGFIS